MPPSIVIGPDGSVSLPDSDARAERWRLHMERVGPVLLRMARTRVLCSDVASGELLERALRETPADTVKIERDYADLIHWYTRPFVRLFALGIEPEEFSRHLDAMEAAMLGQEPV